MSVSSKEEPEKSVTKCLLQPNGTALIKLKNIAFLGHKRYRAAAIIKDNTGCFNCLTIGYTSRTCRSKKTCSRPDCGTNHHVLIHDDNFQVSSCQKASFSATHDVSYSSEKSLLKVMPIGIRSPSSNQRILALLDSGSIVLLVINSLARQLKHSGKLVSMAMETLGNVCKR